MCDGEHDWSSKFVIVFGGEVEVEDRTAEVKFEWEYEVKNQIYESECIHDHVV